MTTRIRNLLLGAVVSGALLAQIYGVAQSYSGRVDIVQSLYDDCLAEANARAVIVANPKTPPAVRDGAAPLTRPAPEGRRELCRAKHPTPSLSPLP